MSLAWHVLLKPPADVVVGNCARCLQVKTEGIQSRRLVQATRRYVEESGNPLQSRSPCCPGSYSDGVVVAIDRGTAYGSLLFQTSKGLTVRARMACLLLDLH